MGRHRAFATEVDIADEERAEAVEAGRIAVGAEEGFVYNIGRMSTGFYAGST
ncbi:MAG: hypothetical protein OXH99_09915 [Bryobacterales bacterium]|nr:hypothetical protein [Bryobacterales bacterium]